MPKSGKFMRKHHSLALNVGNNQVASMEEHYRKEGVLVDHRKTPHGDYEPVVHSPEHFKAMLKARGMVDKG
jgi:hypothetical protein